MTIQFARSPHPIAYIDSSSSSSASSSSTTTTLSTSNSSLSDDDNVGPLVRLLNAAPPLSIADVQYMH
jgi:hypothetical protein